MPVLFLYAIRAAKAVKSLLKEQPYDVIHTHGLQLGCFLGFLLLLQGIRIPHVVMQHGYLGIRGYERYHIRRMISRQLTKVLMRLFPADYYLVLDDGTEIQTLIKLFHELQLRHRIVYHGIDTDFFRPDSHETSADFVILFPHRLESWKRPDLAIEIFERFLTISQAPRARLVMLGPATESIGERRMFAMRNGQVNFVGLQPLERVRDYLRSSRVVIGTSLESNMNRAISEAMACGKPVVVFDSGGTRRLIRHMFNGILVRPGDIDEFAAQLNLLYNNPSLCEEIGKNARETILAERSWERRIETEIAVYREAVSVLPSGMRGPG